jgi:peptide-methionine (S)-S-oxide reductase
MVIKMTQGLNGSDLAVFGGGCFWCTEAVFGSLAGVQSVQSGYCGGSLPSPTYEQVCSKTTGHIEVVQIQFDPSVISYASLLEVFFATHDPTTPGRQGNDVGPQYQSVIFAQDALQLELAHQAVQQTNASGYYREPVCTEIREAQTFWPAESMHADYFALHPEQGYCQFVIAPKIAKFRNKFTSFLKPESIR